MSFVASATKLHRVVPFTYLLRALGLQIMSVSGIEKQMLVDCSMPDTSIKGAFHTHVATNVDRVGTLFSNVPQVLMILSVWSVSFSRRISVLFGTCVN